MNDPFPDELTACLQRVSDATGAQRITARFDVPGMNFPCIAEVAAPGEPLLIGGDDIDHRASETVGWLIEHRRTLVQPDFTSGGPQPPSTLTNEFAVRAQVLGPILHDGQTVGVVSCHSTSERAWTEDEISAVTTAAEYLSANYDSLERFATARFDN
jgi:maleate isomerase